MRAHMVFLLTNVPQSVFRVKLKPEDQWSCKRSPEICCIYQLVNVEWESRAIFLTIYDDLYKTYLWGICITLNLFVALTSA